MGETYFKAIRTDGLDFHTQTVDYGKLVRARSTAGKTITHPDAAVGHTRANHYFSVATVATDCTGMTWPARLLEVEAVGDVWTPHSADMPNKRAVAGLRVIRELPAWQVFGPEGERIVKLIEQRDALTSTQRSALYDEYTKTYDAFWETHSAVVYAGRARRAGLRAAQIALSGLLRDFGVGYSSYGAALALLCRPLVGTVFTQKEYDILSGPWRKVIGEIHPDDKAVK